MFEDLQKAIMEGNGDESLKITNNYLNSGEKPEKIINEGLVAGMNEVGVRFKAFKMYLPEVIMSANAMKKSMEVLKSLISEGDMPSMGKVIMATVEGDLHDIGKNLVSMMLEGAGFDVIDLGVDVAIDKMIEAIDKNGAQVVGISALLTTTMAAMEPAVKRIHDDKPNVKVMVGGAPITQDFADKIGADGFAADALSAIDLARRLIDKQVYH